MKENLSGNFITTNRYLIDDLEKLGLWTEETLKEIKRANGSIQTINNIPESIKKKYKETFEIDMQWLIKASAKRMKWIDQSISTNIFIKTKSGKQLSELYKMAWEYGLKTTYYLRSMAASQIMKATVDAVDEHKNINLDQATPQT
jgi:ribonucleoside-diphosphate reductase alpha chain